MHYVLPHASTAPLLLLQTTTIPSPRCLTLTCCSRSTFQPAAKPQHDSPTSSHQESGDPSRSQSPSSTSGGGHMRGSAFRTLQKAGSIAAGTTRVAVAKGKTMARTSSSSLAGGGHRLQGTRFQTRQWTSTRARECRTWRGMPALAPVCYMLARGAAGCLG